jgi:hypothetical protein
MGAPPGSAQGRAADRAAGPDGTDGDPRLDRVVPTAGGKRLLGFVTCGLPSAFDGDRPAALTAYDPSGTVEDLDHLADLLRPAMDRGDTVVAVVQERAAEPLHARLLAVRAALETTRLVVHRTALPPLAAALLVRSIGDVAGQAAIAPSVLASGISRIEPLVTGAAWLGSVTKLQHPAPSVALHARSLLPGPGFGAVVDAAPKVVKLAGRDALLPIPALEPPGGWRVLVAAPDDVDTDVVDRTLAVRASGAEVVRVPLHGSSVDWWGTAKLIELAYAPRDPARLHQQLLGDGPTACGWCGEAVTTDPCPLCRARTGPAADLAPGAPA